MTNNEPKTLSGFQIIMMSEVSESAICKAIECLSNLRQITPWPAEALKYNDQDKIIKAKLLM